MRSRFLILMTMLAAVSSAPAGAEDAPPKTVKLSHSDSYIFIEPMYATLLDSGRPSGLLMVAIGLDIPDPRLRAIAERALPVLRDDFVRTLVNFAWTNVRPNEPPDVFEIANRLQRVTDRALHGPGARVLLAQVGSRIKQ
jgi:hypothetical protein